MAVDCVIHIKALLEKPRVAENGPPFARLHVYRRSGPPGLVSEMGILGFFVWELLVMYFIVI